MIEFISNSIYLPILAGLASFFLSSSIYLYPVIINVSNIKGLMDTPDSRKLHKINTPTLGGLGIFLAFSLSMIVFVLMHDFSITDLYKLIALMGSAIILVFLGIKDDLTGMAPKKKLVGQLFAVLNVIIFTDIRIENFHGILGFYEIPYLTSIIFSIFVFVLVINAMNLIDGIDGLAGSVSMIASTVFGVLFIVNDNYLMALISFILMGTIIGFLKYNLSTDKKIFMGDSGSLLTGFLLAYQGVCFLNMNIEQAISSYYTPNAPIILLAILSYPLFDLLRVFTIRIKQGRSPFSADAKHIHHKLLRLGLTHKTATLCLATANSLVILLAFLSTGFNIHAHLFITVVFGISIYLIPFLKFFDRESKATNKIINTRLEVSDDNQNLSSQIMVNTMEQEENLKNGTLPINEIPDYTDKDVPKTSLEIRARNFHVIHEKIKHKGNSIESDNSIKN